MTIPDYYVRVISLPPTVRGVTLPNDDGTFSIYINALCDDEVRRKALEHELSHMARDHFYKQEPIALQEAEASGQAAGESTTEAPRTKKLRCYHGLRGLERYLRSIGALAEIIERKILP